MNEQQIKELRAHAGKLVAEGKPLSGAFEYYLEHHGVWVLYGLATVVPTFVGYEWRIAKPKKQLIIWSHPYFKGCATNYGKLLKQGELIQVCDSTKPYGNPVTKSDLRLATPANDQANWQYFHSTPENDAMLRELAKMVKVEVRYFDVITSKDSFCMLSELATEFWCLISNYRITGLQEGWTDNKEEV